MRVHACVCLCVCLCMCVSWKLNHCSLLSCILNMHMRAVDHNESMCLFIYIQIFLLYHKMGIFHGNHAFFNFTLDYIWSGRIYMNNSGIISHTIILVQHHRA